MQNIFRSRVTGWCSVRPVLGLVGLTLLAATSVIFGLALGVAGATNTLPFLNSSFGSEGSGAGQFKALRGVALDGSNGPSKGDVYVGDLGNQRIEKFDAVGRFVLMFGGEVNQSEHERPLAVGETQLEKEAKEDVCTAASRDVCTTGVAGAGGGQFHSPMGIAVDPSSGNVYVVDFSNRRIEKFGPAGEFLLAFGKEVDATTLGNICTAASEDVCQVGKAGTGEDEFEWTPAGTFIAVGSTGTVYVGDENRIQEFESTGQSKGQIALPGAGGTTALAVDGSGGLYAVSQALNGVRKYGATGEQLAEFDSERESSQLTALAVQPGSGDVFVVDTSEGARIRQYLPEGTLSTESSAGPLVESLSLAVNMSGTVYAADHASDMVLFFGEPPREGNPPPSIDAESVVELGEESATVQAQINPFFLETSYRVQYVPDSGYLPSAPEPERYAGPGGGEAPVLAETLGGGATLGDRPASVTLPELSPGTAYHYRFVAGSSAGTTYGQDQIFTTFKPGGLAGLPDSRVYEQVSPQQKNGNNAGVLVEAGQNHVAALYASANGGGDRVAYYQDGPFGETSSGADLYSVSSRNPSAGWKTSAALPPEHLANGDVLGKLPLSFLASAELSRFVFAAFGPFTKENSATVFDEDLGLYRTKGNTSEPEWLSKPTLPSFSEAKPEPGKIAANAIRPVGGSPELGTVYFTYFGTLVPEDDSRAPFVESGAPTGPWGFYEWNEGALSSAGVLPSNSPYPNKPDPYGAVPAVSQTSTTIKYPFTGPLLNQISEDGSKAFFVSPEPSRAMEAGTPTELYVREQTPAGPRTVLVSRDELNGGAPAQGLGAETAVTSVSTQWASEAYVFASPDGSRAFFESMDKLATSATGAEPEGTGPWTYEFNTATEKATYLSGVVGPIAASSRDGSSFIFKNTATGKIELWSGGPAPKEVASFSAPGEPSFEGVGASDGAVFVFDTNTVLTRGSQTFNNSAGLEQAYRYDISTQRLSCISCALAGAPQSPVEAGGVRSARARAIADEGGRVFFATAAKLMSRDVNGVTDVYEWEQAGVGGCRAEEREGGCVYLISSGTSTAPSFYLDNDESGENVFLATRQGLGRNDTDESYDVYDARVNGGFPHEASPAECASGCRAPGVPPVLFAPLTTAFGPSGNLAPPAESQPPKSKILMRAQKLAKALRACAKKPKRRRAACRKRARSRYGTVAKAQTSGSTRRRG